MKEETHVNVSFRGDDNQRKRNLVATEPKVLRKNKALFIHQSAETLLEGDYTGGDVRTNLKRLL